MYPNDIGKVSTLVLARAFMASLADAAGRDTLAKVYLEDLQGLLEILLDGRALRPTWSRTAQSRYGQPHYVS